MPRTDRASRTLPAPIEQVYAALVDPEALARWLPPTGMTGRFEHFDMRPGGSYRLVLTYDDPSGARPKSTDATDIVEVDLVDVIANERVVQRADFVSDDPAFAGTMTMTWKVSHADRGTRVDIVADDVPDGISAADHRAAFAASLAQLAALVES